MAGFSRISIAQAQTIIQQRAPLIADVRDQQSYRASHIEGAVHLSNDTIAEFLAQNGRDRPVIVYCYHGNSSIGAGQFLVEQGFQQVMSMDGGFEAWRQSRPSVPTPPEPG
jgi:thiosulfate sulfurtransferase